MKRLVDTSILIDHLRGQPAAVALLLSFARGGDELWSVTIVRTEVLAGMRRGEERATHRLLDRFRWQDVTTEVADGAGALAREYAKSHSGIDTVDYVLASAARLLAADLVTLNVKHFPMIAGLQAPYR
jgi:predicted nucleic acid-binding protein